MTPNSSQEHPHMCFVAKQVCFGFRNQIFIYIFSPDKMADEHQSIFVSFLKFFIYLFLFTLKLCWASSVISLFFSLTWALQLRADFFLCVGLPSPCEIAHGLLELHTGRDWRSSLSRDKSRSKFLLILLHQPSSLHVVNRLPPVECIPEHTLHFVPFVWCRNKKLLTCISNNLFRQC